MADRRGPAVYTIPAHRAFSDALAAGLIAQYGKEPMMLARGILLLPNNRAVRAMSDAFIRQSNGGLLMPRLVPIGDVDLDERLAGALDPMGMETDIPPAIKPVERQMILARLVQQARSSVGRPVDTGEAMRLAQALAATLDEMLVEQVDPAALRCMEMTAELSAHWQASLELLEIVLHRWPEELARLGKIDLADRRNRLFHYYAQRWGAAPPGAFVIAAGISTTAPAICALLRTIAHMGSGRVVLAELDQNMSEDEWDAIGPAHSDSKDVPARRAHESHPQYGMKLMLDRMGVGRNEVALWRWGGGHDARAERSRNISNAMLVPEKTEKWRMLQAAERTLRGVRALEAAHPAEEAQSIAIILREAIETPEQTAALVTPDRALAARVSAHLRRWGIDADDSAGQPLTLLAPGTLLLALARSMADRFAPVSLLNLLKHPLVMAGEGRVAWLEHVRTLDLLLRGPRPAPGLGGIDALLKARTDGDFDRQADARVRTATWWPQARALLAPLEDMGHGEQNAAIVFAVLREVASALTGERIWAGHQGHAAAALYGEIEAALHLGPERFDIDALPELLDRLLSQIAVRPPQGGHPRIAIFGLIEARLQQADVVVLAGLNEGTWPALPAPDPWLAPRIRQELGLPGLERRIGLAAHDFASGLGAPQVTITRSRRSGNAPAVASRFWLRLQAIAGPQFRMADDPLAWARALDQAGVPKPADRPAPRPALVMRPTSVSVTDVDRLSADPYSFYARKILGLSQLDRLDADPNAAWRGTAVHRILELWFREDKCDPSRLKGRALNLLREGDAHPLLRALWQPRLLAAIGWIGEQVMLDRAEGRTISLVEADGRAEIAGVTIRGKADRIDSLPDGSLGIVDYKTGKPPGARQVMAGYALQLGLLGAIAERGGFVDLGMTRKAGAFEYWSLAKKGDAFGYRESPTAEPATERKVATSGMTNHSVAHFTIAAEKWLTGDAPFIAMLNPELPSYGEYNQLMRLDEWYGRDSRGVSVDGGEAYG